MRRLRYIARGVIGLLVSVALVTTSVVAAEAATATAGASANGTIRLSLASPVGGPTVVTLTGPASLAHSTEAGGLSSRTFVAPAGAYSVGAPDVIVGSLTFRAAVAKRSVVVERNRSTTVTVTYLPAPMASDLRVTAMTGTSVELTWSPPPASARGRTAISYALRRSYVDSPALTSPTQGTGILSNDLIGSDEGLTPGTRYRYSLFTRSQFGWNGPVELEVGTAPPRGSTDAAYVLAPTAVVLGAGDIASAVPTGTGVRLRVLDPALVPATGSAVVLPISPELRGGFLGHVDSVAPDGTAELVAAGLSDAFDFYALPPTEFTSDPAGGEASARVSVHESTTAQGPSTALAVQDGPGQATSQRAASKASCKRSATGQFIDWSPRFDASGSFQARINKTGLRYGPDLFTGAHVSLEYTLGATAQASVEVSGSMACELKLPTLAVQITTSPVPIAVVLDPVAKAEVKGAAHMAGVGVRAEARTHVTADFVLPATVTVDGGVDLTLKSLPAELTAAADLTATVGGDLLVGPGAGTTGAGVIVGVGGRVHPLEAVFSVKSDALAPGPATCLSGDYRFSSQAIVSARAWVSSKQLLDKTIPVTRLQSVVPYPGSPLDVPAGCSEPIAAGVLGARIFAPPSGSTHGSILIVSGTPCPAGATATFATRATQDGDGFDGAQLAFAVSPDASGRWRDHSTAYGPDLYGKTLLIEAWCAKNGRTVLRYEPLLTPPLPGPRSSTPSPSAPAP